MIGCDDHTPAEFNQREFKNDTRNAVFKALFGF